jgi:predicted GNAT family N-acyltransferase
MDASDVRVKEIDDDWDRFDDAKRFIFELLYGPFDVQPDDDWYQPVAGSIHIVALLEEHVVGYARMLPPDAEGWRQVRQVTVAPELRGRGLGRRLMHAMMRRAAAEGASGIWVNARDDVIGFYEGLGFGGEGEHFVVALTGIDHWRMRRELTESGYTPL